jgi:SAM-dependent methyltransferase
MAHYQQLKFVQITKQKFPEFFRDSSVLEVGSWDKNGSIRSEFANCKYLGVDVAEGHGVDLVCEGQNLTLDDGHFDVVVSCECFEHNRHWIETFNNMIRMLKPGGLCLMTCASIGRGEHGTNRRLKDASLTSENAFPDYYCNLEAADFNRSIDLAPNFQEHAFFVNIYSFDLYFVGIKKSETRSEALGEKFKVLAENMKDNTTPEGTSAWRAIRAYTKWFFKYTLAKALGETAFHNVKYAFKITCRKMRNRQGKGSMRGSS